MHKDGLKRYLKDYKKVAEITEKVNGLMSDYLENLELLGRENNILSFCHNYVNKTASSPEAMSDPENIVARQSRFQDSVEKLKRISEFKSKIINGEYDSDLNLLSHPWYFKFLGVTFYFDENSKDDTEHNDSFLILDNLAYKHLLLTLDSAAEFLNMSTLRYNEYEISEENLDEDNSCNECCGRCECGLDEGVPQGSTHTIPVIFVKNRNSMDSHIDELLYSILGFLV